MVDSVCLGLAGVMVLGCCSDGLTLVGAVVLGYCSVGLAGTGLVVPDLG